MEDGPKDVWCPPHWILKTLPSFQKRDRGLSTRTLVWVWVSMITWCLWWGISGGGSPKDVEEDASPYATLWLVVVVAVMWGGQEGLGEDIPRLSHLQGSLCFFRPLLIDTVVSEQSWLWQVFSAKVRNSLKTAPLILSLFSLWPIFQLFFILCWNRSWLFYDISGSLSNGSSLILFYLKDFKNIWKDNYIEFKFVMKYNCPWMNGFPNDTSLAYYPGLVNRSSFGKRLCGCN